MEKTDEEKIKDALTRLGEMDRERDKFLPRWREAQRYVAPAVYDWHNLEAIPQIPDRYSSAPCEYLSTLVSGLTGYSISPNIVWFKLSLENHRLLNFYGVKDWLEQVEEVMNAEFNRSNLYKQISAFVEDAATIGHGVMLCDEDAADGRLRFTTMRPNEIYLDCNEHGEIDTVYRRYLMTVRNTVSFFGEDNVADNVREAYGERTRWNEKIEVLYAAFPREGRDGKRMDAKNKPVAVYHIDLTNRKLMDESGYDENPFSVFLWQQIPGTPYSYSPAMCAMPDIKALNVMRKTSLQICQTSAEPPMRVSATVRRINLIPRGFTYLNSPDEVVEPIRTGENYPVTLQILEDVKQEVKNWFQVDFFLMLQQKQGKMTATEVMELQGEKSAVLSNLVVSLNSALSKIISRSFNLLARSDRLPPPPQSLEGQAEAAMKVDFIGPLAQAQKKYHTLGGIAQALQLAVPIMQAFPNSGDFIDGDALMKRAMEGNGMPQAVIREDDDVQDLRERRAQAEQAAQQQAAQQAMTQELMRNADKMGRRAQSGSPLDELNRQLAGGQNGQASG